VKKGGLLELRLKDFKDFDRLLKSLLSFQIL
jgi:hypothetical protein